MKHRLLKSKYKILIVESMRLSPDSGT